MKTFSCLLMLTAVLAVSCLGDVEQFKRAMQEWVSKDKDASDNFLKQGALYQYFDSIVENVTCSKLVGERVDNETQKAADQWEADKSQLPSIATNLLNNVFPTIFKTFRRCVNDTAFKKDRNDFDNAINETFTEYPSMRDIWVEFGREIGYLTKGEVPSNTSCVNLGEAYYDTYIMGLQALFTQKVDVYSLLSKLTYDETGNMLKMAQKCLVGSPRRLLNQVFFNWLNSNPKQAAMYQALQLQFLRLIKTLPHDQECVQKIEDKLESQSQDAASRFVNGITTIGEIAAEVMNVDLPAAVEDAKKCLKSEIEINEFLA